MGIGRYNSEGYPDPTTYEALKGISREEMAGKRAYRPLVYICSPFAGDMEGNAQKARRYSRFAVGNGAIPVAPHLLFPQFLNEGIEAERQAGLAMGLELLLCCDEVWVFGEATEGMASEIAFAVEQGIGVRFMEPEELEGGGAYGDGACADASDGE